MSLFRGDSELEVESWLEDYLYDERTYLEGLDLQLHDISISELSVEFTDFQITSVTDYKISLEVVADLSFIVNLDIDDSDSAWYDDEERVWVYMDLEKKEVAHEDTIFIDVVADFPLAGDDYMDLKIEEINKGAGIKLKV